MTRNFSNQRRDGMHPSSRNSASDKHRDEQSSRPARPRLSRDAVDRAWENGATRTYADYHPRQNSPTSPAQRQGRPAPAYERSRQPQNRRPNGSSQQYGTSPSTSRPGGYPQRQQPEDGPRRFNQPGYRAPGSQAGLNSERWTRNAAPQQSGGYSERREDSRPPRFQQDGPTNYSSANRPPRFQQDGPNNYSGANRPPRFQQDGPTNYRDSSRPPRFQQDGPNNYGNANRPPRFQQDGPNNYRDSSRPPRFQQSGPNNYGGANRPTRFQPNGAPDSYRSTDQPRSFERSNRDREQFAHGQRGGTPGAGRDNYNPRWQSRPGAQREYSNQQRDSSAPRNDYANERPGRAQFEGDYEHFTDDYERAGTREPAARPERPEPAYERSVTRLPDGRVLKGSRPSQRKQAQFWSGVEGETSGLLSNVSTPQENGEAQVEAEAVPQVRPTARPARPRKPSASGVRKVKTVKTVRADDAKPHSAKVARKNTQGAPRSATRPSRRGYKWPTAGESSTNNA